MNHITVAYAIADDYEYAMISMISMIKNADKSTFYRIVVLVDDTFKNDLKKDMRDCLSEYTNWDMRFLSVGDTFANAQSHVEWIKTPTYYRLLLPELLQKEERCIYLDGDTIICRDLWGMYNTRMDDCNLAGVKAPSYMMRPDQEEYCKQAGLPDLQHYINAGVLLMNLKKMRQDNLTERFLRLISRNLESQDQDIINTVCYGKIHFLPFQYNVMTKYVMWKYEEYPQEFTLEELQDAWSTPAIIHYADRVKPWNDPSCAMGDYWWNICKSSKLWEYFYKKLEDVFFEICVHRNNRDKNAFSTKKQSLLYDLKVGQKIAIYGAGERARVALKYLRERGLSPEYFLVSAKNGNEACIDNIPVYSLDEIPVDNKDTVVIIGTSERYHAEIVNTVLAYDFANIVPMSDYYN